MSTQPKACPEDGVWRVARCRPNTEFALGASLEAAGIQSYVPSWKSGRIFKPLLGPSYVLAQIADFQIRRAHTCAGFSGWLHFGRIPAVVRPEEISWLREAERLQATPVSAPAFSQGQKVRIVSGVFASHTGTWSRTSKDGKLVFVELPITCGRAVTVQLDPREVSPIAN